MKINNILPIALIGGAAYYLFTKSKKTVKQAVASYTVTPIGARLDTTYVFSPKLFIKMEVNNPSNLAVNVTGISGTINFSGKQIATLNNSQKIPIKANAVTQFDVQCSIDSLQTVLSIINLKTLTLNINGTVEINGIDIDFKKTLII
jgi:hypothetical protein